MTGVEPLPTVVVKLAIEPRQDDRALRQPRDHAQQVGRRENAAGRTGGDDRFVGRIALQPPSQSTKRIVAMGRRIDAPLGFENPRPLRMHQRQELFHLGPVLGQRQRRKFTELGQVRALRFHFVHHGAQAFG